MTKYEIGAETTLTSSQWIKAYIATLDHKGDIQHETYEFQRDNRYEDDDLDEELTIYKDLCQSLGIHF
ncbi:hypothetical protein AO286_28675 [Pseudomonas syringae]|uniref:hypothetical protein n=1 Tax=Pseudomonas syringae TaxID=317 RepID=UPI0001CC1747|nr:hypothetical protein [Pseudomonas syringae]KEZ74059.1 hypothetical protein C5I_0109255 [Pseudomonas syringae pv. syringae FF5]MCK9750816.1 hypothetical protein [Pseudomonas syringae pv. syringae]PHN69299.1 hypothetical protein AO286_28675 [Pseudomonas syringae]POQ07506.1 hypothetical protein CXB40_14920 [Pseudomonas syringae pv. avii]